MRNFANFVFSIFVHDTDTRSIVFVFVFVFLFMNAFRNTYYRGWWWVGGTQQLDLSAHKEVWHLHAATLVIVMDTHTHTRNILPSEIQLDSKNSFNHNSVGYGTGYTCNCNWYTRNTHSIPPIAANGTGTTVVWLLLYLVFLAGDPWPISCSSGFVGTESGKTKLIRWWARWDDGRPLAGIMNLVQLEGSSN